jgi:UDP-N-acetylglucosamine 2-epimerase (non-hydrolysing)
VATDRLSDYLFAPSPDAAENLTAEGYRHDQIHLVGNVMIDTLLRNVERARARESDVRRMVGVADGPFALATLHRPSNVDDDHQLGRLVNALARVAERIPVVFPAHPRTATRLRRLELPLPDRVRVIEPLGYLDFLALQAAAAVVLTDSGGVQEETTALGVPCLTLRENTERPITVTEGTNRVVGVDPEAIVHAAFHVLDHGVEARRPALWDGHAGDRIADLIVAGGRASGHRRPTER